MLTPTPEMIEAVNKEYEPLSTMDESHRQRMPRWARVLAVIAVLGIIAAVVSRLAR
jgi:hypothetical protein